MSILIIGGAGYIGSHTVKYFIEQNEDVIIVDNLLTGHKEAVLSDKFYNCDIRDKEALDKVFIFLSKFDVKSKRVWLNHMNIIITMFME